ncbi:AAA family ATPase [Altererythrobacter sp. H2]|uniref:AAA family ATPase n=1 Tax=Altererythrobacter sp. H2 TaxID=3108391 RepID=UPI002B4BA692|nr:AAA family ATPase [Altererythrobacter sp. H2]WRK96924.1 AAA family ATPase [Altererythrobacter sp. H2]
MQTYRQTFLLALGVGFFAGGTFGYVFFGDPVPGALVGGAIAFAVILGWSSYAERVATKRDAAQRKEILHMLADVGIGQQHGGQVERPKAKAPATVNDQAGEALTSLKEYEPGELIAGKYLVKRVIQGGMGRVYVVDYESKTIVLKAIRSDRGDLEQFAEEARTWVGIGRHDNIVSAQAVTDFAKRKDTAETLIRRHFIADCRVDYAKTAKDLEHATAALNRESDAVTAFREAARELRQRIRTHGPAAEVINNLIAAYLGHGELTINPVDGGYELQRHGTPISGVPSEGEKTAIAISYFLSSIEADNRKLKDVIVVVDDPVSSLDTKALNFACSLVRTRLEKAAQVFILTHNLQCMNEFRKAWKGKVRPAEGKVQTATFLFIDVAIPEGQRRRSSTIIEMSRLLREYDSEYHFLFSHVLRFVNEPDAYDDHGYMIPNVIRRVLDVFLAFKCPGGGGLPSQLDKLVSDYPALDRERLAGLERLTVFYGARVAYQDGAAAMLGRQSLREPICPVEAWSDLISAREWWCIFGVTYRPADPILLANLKLPYHAFSSAEGGATCFRSGCTNSVIDDAWVQLFAHSSQLLRLS